ncbi:MAG: hypothetical protein ACYDHP_00720 [Ferrimicrobium sp.]
MTAFPVYGHDDEAKQGAEDLVFHSVTTVLGVMDKPALTYWSAEETAKAAVRAASSLTVRIAEDGEAETVKWLTGARFRTVKGQRTAAELGTAVHAVCEEIALTGKRPTVDKEVSPFVDQFEKFLERFAPTFIAAEMPVFSPKYGYAGTLDAIVEIEGATYLLDYKTTRKDVDSRGKATGPYPEVSLQLAAYRHAELTAPFRTRRTEKMRRRYYLLGPEERANCVPLPEVAGALVLHLTPGHERLVPVDTGPRIFGSFLHLVQVARFSFDIASTVFGPDL